MPIITSINVLENTSNTEGTDKVPRYNYKTANWSKFTNILSASNIDLIDFNNSNVNDLYTNLIKEVHAAAKESIPLLKPKHNGKNASNIWWSNECEIAKRMKKKAFKTYLKNPTPETHKTAKQAKKHYNCTLDQAKRQHWNALYNDESGNKSL